MFNVASVSRIAVTKPAQSSAQPRRTVRGPEFVGFKETFITCMFVFDTALLYSVTRERESGDSKSGISRMLFELMAFPIEFLHQLSTLKRKHGQRSIC